MTQVYNIPVTRAFTNLGKIGAGFQLFFFDKGTTTKKTVFADEALTTPLTNPVIADSNGYFPQIFMQSTGDAYKAILSDENDTDPPTSPIWTADPIEVDANNINAFATRPAQHWGTTTNTATEYQISPKTPITSYTDDLLFSLEIHLDNTGTATLAAEDGDDLGNFLTALNIKKYDGIGGKVDIEPGDLQGNQTYIFRVDSVEFVVLNPEKPFFDGRNLTNLVAASETVAGIVERLTNSELATATDTTRYASAANLLSLFNTSSQATNGFARLPINIGGAFDEIIIQWGTNLTTGNNVLQNLPLTFPNSFLSLNLGTKDDSAVSDSNSSMGFIVNTSSFRYGTGSGTNGAFFMAIGF